MVDYIKTGWAWWDARTNGVKNLICLAFLFVMPLFLTPDTIFGDKQFIPSDIVQWRGGAEATIQAREKLGYEPLWSANMYGGMPSYFINYVISVYNFDTIVDQLFKNIFPAGTFWMALFGFFFFFRELKASHFASIFGSLIVAFTTYIPIIIGAGHNTKFRAFSYIPWLFLAFLWILGGKKNKVLAVSTFSIALALELRAGHPQVTYYFVVLMIVVWLFDTWEHLKTKTYIPFLKKNALFVIAGIIALLSVVHPYWSKMDFTPFSTRGGSVSSTSSGLHFDYAMAWSQGWGELLTLAIPNLYGGDSGSGAYWGPKVFTSGPHYFGAIALLFFVLGWMYYRGKFKIPFLTGGFLAVLFSLGNQFSWFNEFFFNYFPYFSKFRTPEMWLMMTVFAFSVVAVWGFDEMFIKLKMDKKWLYGAGGISAFGLLFALASSSVLNFEKEGERHQIAEQIARSNNVSTNDPRVAQAVNQIIKTQLVPEREKLANADSWRFVILTGLGVVCIFLVSNDILKPTYAAFLVIGLTAFDMISVGKRYIPEYSKAPDTFSIDSKVKQQLTTLDEYIREHQFAESEVWPYRTFPIASNAFNNAAPSFYYPSIGGYTAVKIGAFQDLIDEALYDVNGIPRTAILSMLNVKYLTIPQQGSLPGFHTAFTDGKGSVLEMNSVLPKAWFSYEIQAVNSSKLALEAIKSNSFRPETETIVESYSGLQVFETDEQTVITVKQYEPRIIKLETQNEYNGFLVMSEVYYPKGWKAFVDEKEVPIYKTNFVLRGIEVPAGTHQVRFEFNPISYTAGVKIAWGGTIAMWLLFVVGIFLNSKEKDHS